VADQCTWVFPRLTVAAGVAIAACSFRNVHHCCRWRCSSLVLFKKRKNLALQCNSYNGGWPSARLFGWSAADWSRPTTNISISSERKRKSKEHGVLLRKKIMNRLVVDLLQQKGLSRWKVLKNVVNEKEKCFLSSQTRWSWQYKRACTSFWTWIFTRTLLGRIRENHLKATLLPQLSKFALASGVYLHCA
jgi:hypothetical protein